MYILILEQLFLEALLDALYFPIWWYSRGFLYALKNIGSLVRAGNERLAPGVWLANIFVPMYGQYDWRGRLISFMMRLFQIFVRGIALLLWLFVCLCLVFVWLLLPILVVSGIMGSLTVHSV